MCSQETAKSAPWISRSARATETTVYLERVSTDANPADGHSGDKMDAVHQKGWVVTQPVAWEPFLEGLGRSV